MRDLIVYTVTHFNSRPHKEVDSLLRRPSSISDVFQLTTSQGGRLNSSGLLAMSFIFQLTTSQGGRHKGGLLHNFCLYFNSRPHKEVDVIYRFDGDFYSISTHDLTRRSTAIVFSPPSGLTISTHDLTRRSTQPCRR